MAGAAILTVEIRRVVNGVLVSIETPPTRDDPLCQHGNVGPVFYSELSSATDDLPRLIRDGTPPDIVRPN